MLNLRTIFRSLALGAALTGFLATPAVSSAASIFVSIGPPAPPIYVRPAIPAYGYIWVDGYWAWGDDGYYWVPGYWTQPPYEGAIWQPGIWGYGGGGWGWTAGYWAHPVGYWGGVYYSNPWPWVGAYGICHEGFYRNSFYDRGYYNGWYNDRWGHAHGRDFDDHRWNQARSNEAQWNRGVNGSLRESAFSGRRSTDNRSALSGQGQRGVANNGAGFIRGARTENRANQQLQAQRPLVTSRPANNGSMNRSQSYANRPSPQTDVRRRYSTQGANNSYRAQQAYRPQQNYGGQRYSTPQTTNAPRYNASTPRYNQQQAYGGGGQRNSAPAQRYSAPAQHYSAGAQRSNAPQAQRYSGGGNAGGGQHGHR